MSGPKCGSYTVETPHAREARERAAAVADYERVRAEFAVLRREAISARAAFGGTVAVPELLRAFDGTSTELRAAERAARTSLQAAEEGLRASAAVASRARWEARVERVVDDRPIDIGIASSPAVPDLGARRDRFLDDLAEIAAAWPADAPTEVLDAATDEVRSARSTSGAALGVARARDELTRMRAARRAEQERTTHLAGLRARVVSVRDWTGGDGSGADELVADVDAPDADPERLRMRVDRFVAEAHARRDRDEAGGILADVLVEMGYTLGESFSTGLGGTADVLVGRPGWSDHAVSLRMDGTGRVYTHVVRSAGVPDGDDARIDREFCDDYDALAARAGRRGLRLETVRRFEPGTRPVREVDGARVAEVATATRPRRRERSR